MRREVIFSRLARRHLDEISDYLTGRAGTRVADRIVDQIVDFCERFADSPYRGTRRDEIHHGLRTVGYRRRATVTFTVDEKAVIILGIYYGGRDYTADFRDEETD